MSSTQTKKIVTLYPAHGKPATVMKVKDYRFISGGRILVISRDDKRFYYPIQNLDHWEIQDSDRVI